MYVTEMEIRVIEPFFTNHSYENPNEYKSEFTTKLLCGFSLS